MKTSNAALMTGATSSLWQAQQQAYNQALTDRQAGLQGLGLYSPFVNYGGQVAGQASGGPQYASVSQSPVNMAGLEQQQFQSEMDAWQAAQDQKNALWGGLANTALGIATLPVGGPALMGAAGGLGGLGAAGGMAAGGSLGGNALMGLGRSLWS